jgi:hypothetical protein
VDHHSTSKGRHVRAREIIFVSLIAFLVAWSALSAFALLQALVGFTDTYAELVTKYPSLATNEARQATLQTVMLHEIANGRSSPRRSGCSPLSRGGDESRGFIEEPRQMPGPLPRFEGRL